MGKYMVIALNNGTAEQRQALSDFVDAKPWGYWHWFHDLWILPSKGTPPGLTATALYEEIEKVPALKKATILVLGFDRPPEYFGKANKDGWKWMEEHGGRAV
jgi:hypothetical protein